MTSYFSVPGIPSELINNDDVFAKKTLKDVCSHLGVSEEEVKSISKKRTLTIARMVYAKIMRNENIALVRIGRAINRDHSTILATLRKAVDVWRYDPLFREMISGTKYEKLFNPNFLKNPWN